MTAPLIHLAMFQDPQWKHETLPIPPCLYRVHTPPISFHLSLKGLVLGTALPLLLCFGTLTKKNKCYLSAALWHLTVDLMTETLAK